ncbi:fasciclin domain-containing protein [Elioraea sp.]|uniref:fasciclin domain-containing protein n=1 Tax=Elioraea sp. TaxID=2185103 RepID=UPI003F710F67
MVTRRTMGLMAPAVALAATGVALTRPAQAARPTNLLEVLKISGDLRKFAELVKLAGLEQELTKPGRFGLFAPHDPYFNSLNAPTMQALTSDRERLQKVIKDHITTDAITVLPGGGGGSEVAAQTTMLTTLTGRTVVVWNGGGGLPRIEGRVIWVANLSVSNGVAHCIDGLIGGWVA